MRYEDKNLIIVSIGYLKILIQNQVIVDSFCVTDLKILIMSGRIKSCKEFILLIYNFLKYLKMNLLKTCLLKIIIPDANLVILRHIQS